MSYIEVRGNFIKTLLRNWRISLKFTCCCSFHRYPLHFPDLFEKLKVLGYPKPLKTTALYTTQGSLDNFKLVFDIMGWLIDQYEPGTQLEGGTATEIDRTLLVRSAVEFLAIKAGLKLSPMRLYSSSMASAPELLKVVDLIMKRAQVDESTADTEQQLADIDIDDRVGIF